jgi:hypothetical protein
MSSDPFALLGLDRKTATEADVRKAYAERLKVTRPEDDRAAFMALREAFERARQELNWHHSQTGDAETLPHTSGMPQEQEVADEESDFDHQQEDSPFHPGVSQLVQSLEAGGEDSGNLEEIARTGLNNPDYFGIDESSALAASLRLYLCLATGMKSHVESSEIYLPYNTHWTAIWPFDLDQPSEHWPKWLTLEVYDLLNSNYHLTDESDLRGTGRLVVDWLTQVRLELQRKELPSTEAMFQRVSSVLPLEHNQVSGAVLAKMIQSCTKGSDQQEAKLSDDFRNFLLEATSYGKRSQVSDVPRWLTAEVYDAIAKRCGWFVADRKRRQQIDREKMILSDLSKKRSPKTPASVREAAWLEIVRAEIAWRNRPVGERFRKNFHDYSERRVGEGIVVSIIVVAVVLFFVIMRAVASSI